MCSLTTEGVLLHRMCMNYRMCSLIIEGVLLLQKVFSYYRRCSLSMKQDVQRVATTTGGVNYRMCSLTIECVLLL